MGGREEAKKFLYAENPAQALLNSMGVFVRVSFRWQGWSLASWGDSGSSASSREGRWKAWRCWQRDQKQAGGTTPSLPEKSSALLEAFPVPVTGSGSPIAAEIKSSFLVLLSFPAHADAQLSVSMSSQAGFGRITANFSAGPYTCNLILGKWCLKLCG